MAGIHVEPVPLGDRSDEEKAQWAASQSLLPPGWAPETIAEKDGMLMASDYWDERGVDWKREMLRDFAALTQLPSKVQANPTSTLQK